MGTLAITGVSGPLGQAVLRRLDAAGAERRVVGIDPRWPAFNPPRLQYYGHDLADRAVGELLRREGVDRVLHLAVPWRLRDEPRVRRQVLEGAQNLLAACAAAGVRHLVVRSSTVVYGPREEQQAPLGEEAALRGHPRVAFARDLVKVELLCEAFAEAHPEVVVTRLRAAPVVGRGASQVLQRLLSAVPCLPRVHVRQPELQFLHLDDMLAATLRALERPRPGAFNLVPARPVGFARLAALLGKRVVWTPAPLLYLAWELGHRLGLSWTPTSSAVLGYLTQPWLADGERASAELDFRARHTAEEAIQAMLGVEGGKR
ncbi:MAG TPA: NAD-dependent epimerase/dehydratase family protein [Myxococcota bacterium]|nr:NAD-dependent epimerase/dehydratase family protein [Myxococcota bacterium]HRY94165.1 NAD-dependent epimerase/dehydratase family protein [Myxococcota bacterium]HSA23186.1 NAD-dependent epimerase/dehydratase family protein [Myxococcota bacterium]